MNNQFADKEMLQDVLTSQKNMTNNYNAFANEMSTDQMKSQFMNILKEEHDIQMDLFKEMQKRGWYQTPQAKQEKIAQTKTKFDNMKKSL